MTTLYLPGVGNVDLDVYRVHQAVNQYDENLSFKQNPETGDYCVYVRTPRPHGKHNPPEVPVLGFGREVPHPDEAIRRIYNADTVRHGVDELLNSIDRHNSELKKQMYGTAVADATENTAEHIEFAMRKVGDSPVIKSLRKVVKA